MAVNYSLLGSYVRRYRNLRKLTQAKLADKINVSPVYISNIETGKARPSIDVLINIADALDVTMDLLLIGNQKHGPNLSETLFGKLFADCDPQERCIIFEIAMMTKQAFENTYTFLKKNKI